MRNTAIERRSKIGQCITTVTLSCFAAGCGSVPSLGEGLTNMGTKALESIGYKKPELPKIPELPEAAKPARILRLRIAASDSLNVDDQGKSLSLLVRIYKLRSVSSFLNAPYETFGDATKEKQILGDELIESRELVLLPGQQANVNEPWSRDAVYVGVVALYRTPGSQQWRHAFELETLPVGNGIVLGAHACALSLASGTPVGGASSTQRVTSINCPIRRTAGPVQSHAQERKS